MAGKGSKRRPGDEKKYREKLGLDLQQKEEITISGQLKIRGENFIADFYFTNVFNLDIGY